MKITKHSQSCFILESNGSRIIIDPGKYLIEKEGVDTTKLGDFDAILITHKHADHLEPKIIEDIVDNSNRVPLVLLNTESRQVLLESANASIPSDKIKTLKKEWLQIGNFKIIPNSYSQHGPLPNGQKPPKVIGYLINDGKTIVYHPGDTTMIDESSRPDIVLIPICGTVAFNIHEAKEALSKLNPKIAIPIHYDNSIFPADPQEFKQLMEDSGIEIKILDWGESIEV